MFRLPSLCVFCTFCSVLILITAYSGITFAETYEVGPGEDVEGAINSLSPGDELIIGGGEYTLDGRFSFDLVATEGAPIVIRAADGETPHFHRPGNNQNIIDIDNGEYVTLRGLEFSGGSAGVRISGAYFLTIEECEIHDTDDVALRANDEDVFYESLRILRNHIYNTDHTGEGMYLGCNKNGCQVANSLIEGNYIHHTNGPDVTQGDGIELKEGSYGNIIRDNVIHDTNYPCILTYSAVGNGSPNIIERNVLWNCGNHGIQTAADAIIRNNIIVSSNADGIALQPHQNGDPENLTVVHNTILHSSNNTISLRGAIGSVIIANNALYAQNGYALMVRGGSSADVVVEGNAGTGGIDGFTSTLIEGNISADFVSGHFNGAPPIDVFPAAGGVLVGGGNVTYVVENDFNGTLRNGVADIGAYVFDADGNPGWELAESFKDETPTTTDGDADVDADVDADADTDGDSDVVPGSGDEDGCSCGVTSSSSSDQMTILMILIVFGSIFYRRRRYIL